MTRHHPAGTHPDPDIAKLPKWAQQRFSTLEMRLEEARAALAIAQGGVAEGALAWHGDRHGTEPTERRPLIDDCAIFQCASGTIEVSPRAGRIKLYAEGGSIVVVPDVSNVIEAFILEDK